MIIVLRYWKELSIVLLTIGLWLSLNTCQRKQDDNKLLLSTIDSAYTKAQYYKNKNGDLVGQVKIQELTIAQVRDYANELSIDRDRLKQQVGGLKNLVGYWQGKASVRDTFSVPLRDTIIIAGDSSGAVDKFFVWSNDYLFLDGVINTSDNILSISYKYQFKFELTTYYKPKSFTQKLTQPFKPKQLVADLYFSDPNLRAIDFTGIVIKQDKKKFYETAGFKIGVGFGLGLWAAKKLL